MQTFSYSAVRAWRTCHRQFDFGYVQRLEHKVGRPQLYRGTLVHKCIAAWVEKGKWKPVIEGAKKEYRKLLIEERELFGDVINDVPKIMERYVERYENERSRYVKINGCLTEIPVELQLGGQKKFFARIDGVQKIAGEHWIVEHKTHEQIPSERDRLTDIQGVIYAHVLETTGAIKRVQGVLWDYIRPKLPTEPEVLKNGTLTTRSNLDTDHATYLTALRKGKFDIKDYREVLLDLKSKPDTWFVRNKMKLNRPYMGQIISELETSVDEADMAVNATDNSVLYVRNFGMHCSWCSYRPLCEAEAYDLDVDFVLRNDYRTRPSSRPAPVTNKKGAKK